jgi:hypothetical protein
VKIACSGAPDGRWILFWVFSSMTRAASLTRRNRKVVELHDAPDRAFGHDAAHRPQEPISASVQEQEKMYPDGPIAVEALRVIGVAMAEAGVVGLGRPILSRRERMVMVEPRGTGK